MTLATELVDWRRFATPTQLMAFVGLVSREDSSDTTEVRGAITKAGNSQCRHVLVQAAWAYRHAPRVGAALARRQRGQPAAVITMRGKRNTGCTSSISDSAYRKRGGRWRWWRWRASSSGFCGP